MRDDHRRIIKMLTKKPHYDIIREYLVSLELDNKKVYLSKISNPEPFQIKDKQSRVERSKDHDAYKDYIQKMKRDTPSRRHILEVITKVKHEPSKHTKNFNSTPDARHKVIDSTKVLPPPSYKELSDRKKKLRQAKLHSKMVKKLNDSKSLMLKPSISEEKAIKIVEKFKPKVVTLESLAKYSISRFYNSKTPEAPGDTTMNFVQNIIGVEEISEEQPFDGITSTNNFEDYYLNHRNENGTYEEPRLNLSTTPLLSIGELIHQLLFNDSLL